MVGSTKGGRLRRLRQLTARLQPRFGASTPFAGHVLYQDDGSPLTEGIVRASFAVRAALITKQRPHMPATFCSDPMRGAKRAIQEQVIGGPYGTTGLVGR
jgi:hypothetical protein